MNSRPRTLYVTDLDGTLLDGCSRVSAASAAMLTEMVGSGVLITAATARTPATVQSLLAPAHFSLPVVVMTGAATWDLASQRYLDVSRLSPDVAVGIIDLCRRAGLNPLVYTLAPGSNVLDVYHSAECNRQERSFIDERSRLPLKRFHLDFDYGDSGRVADVVLTFVMGPRDRVFAAADAVRSRFGDRCSVSAYVDIFGSDTGILEVYDAGVSKANAILGLKKRLGADRLVVFGDNLNDLPMMAVADASYAVANALPEVRSAATAVTGYNTADAVPRTIASLEGFKQFAV